MSERPSILPFVSKFTKRVTGALSASEGARRPWRVVAVVVPLAAAAFIGCGAGQAARPADPTYAGAMGEGASGASCTSVGEDGAPLVVDWKPEQRTDLEAVMTKGVAVVHYDCKGMKLLADCTVEGASEGAYAYIGTTREEKVLSITNADEAKANLPLNGGSLGASMSRGSSLEIGLVMIGKQTTTATSVARDQLRGRCDGATHFVRAASVGAFAMKTGTAGKVSAAGEIFGFGASSGSSSDKLVANKAGDVEACKRADAEGTKPPQDCAAPINIRLLSISEPAPAALSAAPSAAGGDKRVREVVIKPVGCPAGTVLQQGKCAAPAPNVAHACKPDDASECAKQCEANDATSCGSLAYLHMHGIGGVAVDKAKAAALYERACEGAQLASCSNLGDLYLSGEGVEMSDAKATDLYAKACSGGNAEGCYNLGTMIETGHRGVKKDLPRALRLFSRACDAGFARACGDLGSYYFEGDMGVPADVQRGLQLFAKACIGGALSSCTYLGKLYKGADHKVPADKAKALKLLEYSCGRGSGMGCTSLGFSYEKGDIVPADLGKALALFKRGCALKDASGCAEVKKHAQ